MVAPLVVLFILLRFWRVRLDTGIRRIPIPPLLASNAFWIAAIGLGVFLRIANLTRLYPWPNLDEGLFGFIASHMAVHGWDGRFLYSVTQLPPLTHWALMAWFRFIEPSLVSLWGFPSVISILVLFIAYPAFRTLLDARAARIATLLLAFSFWPLHVGRAAVNLVLFLFLEFAILALLGAWRNSPEPRRGRWILLLGLCNAVGFYSYLGWPVVMLLTGMMLFVETQNAPSRRRTLLLFALPAFLLPLPILRQAFLDGYGGYLARIGFASGRGNAGEWFHSIAVYLGSLLWGVETPLFAFKPMWGGLLDPLLGALFLAGLVLLIRHREHPSRRFLLPGLVISLMPALLTRDFEAFRLTAAIPFVLAVAACSFDATIRALSSNRRTPVILLLLAACAAMSAYHLFVAQPAYFKRDPSQEDFYYSREYAAAFRTLHAKASKEGPGWIMPQMHSDPYDQTLSVAVHPFDALENPRHRSVEVRWAAFIVNIHHLPFLDNRFPGVRWQILPWNRPRPDGEWVLGILPVEPGNRETLEQWGRFHRQVQKITHQVLNCGVERPRTGILRSLESLRKDASRDRFLTSLVHESLALNHGANRDPESMVRSYEQAAKEGYPAAHLLNELGVLAIRRGDREAAQAYFRGALAAPIDRTPARKNLQLLEKYYRDPG